MLVVHAVPRGFAAAAASRPTALGPRLIRAGPDDRYPCDVFRRCKWDLKALNRALPGRTSFRLIVFHYLRPVLSIACPYDTDLPPTTEPNRASGIAVPSP